MYYRGYYGHLRKKGDHFEGHIKDICEEVSYSGATEDEAEEEFQKAVDKYIETKRKHKKKVSLTLLGVISALVFIMVLTCPNSSKHKEKFVEVVMATMSDNNEDDDDMAYMLMFSKMFGMDESILSIIKTKVVTKDYFVFSVGYVRIDGKNVKVSFGILGHVFTTIKSEEINKIVNMD